MANWLKNIEKDIGQIWNPNPDASNADDHTKPQNDQ